MKVILLKDVKKLGKTGEVIEVSEGYARNFLFKTKSAVEADNKHLNDLKMHNQSVEHKKTADLEKAKELAEVIKSKPIIILVKTGEGDKIYGSVTNKEVSKEIEKQLEVKVDKKKVTLKEPIKHLGKHVVKVKLHQDVVVDAEVHINKL